MALISFFDFFSEKSFICEKCERSVQYYGRKFKFLVKRIVGQFLLSETFALSGTCIENVQGSLSDSIANLNLSDSLTTESESMHDDSSFVSSSANNLSQNTSKCLTNQSGEEDQSLDQFEDKDESSKQCSELENSPDTLTSPVRRDTNTASERTSTPKTPLTDRSFNIQDHFCTPKVVKVPERNVCCKFYKVTAKTKIVIEDVNDYNENGSGVLKKRTVKYSDIGGLSKQISMLKEMVHTPIEQPELLKSYGKLFVWHWKL